MNIWLVNHYAKAPGRAGGNRHFSSAKELQQRGHKVTIIASSFDHLSGQEVRLEKGERYRLQNEGEIPFLWIRTPPYSGNSPARAWNMVSFLLSVLRTATPALLGQPDVVWGSSPHLFAALAAQRLARRYSAPFVLEVRDLWPQTLVDLGGISPGHPFIRVLDRMERYLYRQADRVITLLPLAHAHLVEKGAEAAKIVWIPNGVDLGIMDPPSPPPAKPNGIFTVMYAGAHGLANDLDRLVEAAEIVKQEAPDTPIEFCLVGDGPEKPRLRRMAMERGIQNIRFEDAVPKPQVYDVLRSADAFVMLLRDSPLFRWGISPNKLFDYMAMARPIIFSVSTPVNPVAESGAGITVPAGSARAVADAVMKLAQMTAKERWAMGQRGRQYAEERHSYRLLAQRLAEVLESVSLNSRN